MNAKKILFLVISLFFIASCALSESAIQTAIAQTQTAAFTPVDTDTPSPSPGPTGTEISQEEVFLTPGATESPVLGTEGTPAVEGIGTSTPIHLTGQTRQATEPVNVEPYGQSPEMGLPVVLVSVMLLIFMSLNKEGQGPKK